MNTPPGQTTLATSHSFTFVSSAPITFIDVHLQDLFLAQDFASSAGFAAVSVAKALALTSAADTDGGDLLHHAGE